MELTEGVIAAKRHIHMTPADAEEYGVKDKDVVSVKVDTDGRSLILAAIVLLSCAFAEESQSEEYLLPYKALLPHNLQSIAHTAA